MNMNVSLTDELSEFVKAQISSGRYTSASEVVREAPRIADHGTDRRSPVSLPAECLGGRAGER